MASIFADDLTLHMYSFVFLWTKMFPYPCHPGCVFAWFNLMASIDSAIYCILTNICTIVIHITDHVSYVIISKRFNYIELHV